MNALAIPILLGSLAGSLHCAAMCGPFVAALVEPGGRARTLAASQAAYHLGRLVSYLVLGAAAGLLGGALDLAFAAAGVGRASALLAGALLVLWGGSQLVARRKPMRLGRRAPRRLGSLLGALLVRFRRLPALPRALLLGLSSSLVPCGWLYAFVATAAASGQVAAGLGVMFAFWLGTLPALTLAAFGLRSLLARLGGHARTASASLIVLSGVALIALRLGAAPTPTDGPPAASPAPCPLHGP